MRLLLQDLQLEPAHVDLHELEESVVVGVSVPVRLELGQQFTVSFGRWARCFVRLIAPQHLERMERDRREIAAEATNIEVIDVVASRGRCAR